MTAATMTAVVLDGPVLRAPDGTVIACLVGDGTWVTPEGATITELVVDVPTVRARVSSQARRDADEAWMRAALEDLRRLAASRETFTPDDVWAVLRMPPREARMIGNLLARAKALGICEPTSAHRPSRRGINHGRPVRVWRSL